MWVAKQALHGFPGTIGRLTKGYMTTRKSKQSLEAMLISKRQDLLHEIRAQASELPVTDHVLSLSERLRREDVVEKLDVLTGTIAQIDSALQAITEGLYGTCALCASPIAETRLRSVPWATYCLQCQSQLEQLAAASSCRACRR
jgi:RNA polymerase-binding transcription factor DksA